MRAILERTAAAWALLGGLGLLAIVLVTAFNVGAIALDRAAGAWGGSVAILAGYEDFVRVTISSAALMLFPYCQLRRGHVGVDLFVERLPVKAQAFLDRLSLALMAGLALFLAYWMWFGMLETRADGAVSRVLGWAEWPFYLPGLVSLVLWALAAIAMLVDPDPAEPAAAGPA